MKSAAFTIKAFGVYAALTGVTLMIAPGVILPMLGFADAADSWVRVVGALALVVGYYYWALGAANARAFFVISVQGRMLFCAACLGLVALADAPLPLIALGLVDVAGAAWTLMALRREADAAPAGA